MLYQKEKGTLLCLHIGYLAKSKKMLRLLKALYHPRNQYLLQLDDRSSESERMDLAISVKSIKVFEEYGNVNVIGKSYAINRMGSSALSAPLHAAALLLKLNPDWEWFITLTASDYPLMTQDDILHAFTFLPRYANFIHYTNKTVRNKQRDINQIVVDQGLHYEKNSPLFFAVESRDTPDAFKLFRAMWLILWDTDPSESQLLDMSHYDTMLETGAAFARPFGEGDVVLEKIDDLILNRSSNGLVQGEWCSNSEINKTTKASEAEEEFCSQSSNVDAVKPGPFGIKLKTLQAEIVNSRKFRTSQCKSFERW
ncbi:Beta-glucuronosyltransferase GlcAT14A [Glycine max]|nr:Beta-glucuronosyltransferase GlcAT14A [Glycine max]